jgi:hypothetical protein
MKVRHIKHLAQLRIALQLGFLRRHVACKPFIIPVFEAEPEPIYVVSRVKDGEVVLETESYAEALALVEKHARQKKAKLVVHLNGEEVVFVEGETAA